MVHVFMVHKWQNWDLKKFSDFFPPPLIGQGHSAHDKPYLNRGLHGPTDSFYLSHIVADICHKEKKKWATWRVLTDTGVRLYFLYMIWFWNFLEKRWVYVYLIYLQKPDMLWFQKNSPWSGDGRDHQLQSKENTALPSLLINYSHGLGDQHRSYVIWGPGDQLGSYVIWDIFLMIWESHNYLLTHAQLQSTSA